MAVKPPKDDRRRSTAQEFKKIGAYVKRSDEGKERRAGFKELCDELKKDVIAATPKQSIMTLQEKLDTVVGKIREHAIPWGRAGSDPEMAKLVFLWEKLIGRAKSFLTVMKQIVGQYHEAEAKKEAKKEDENSSEYSTSWDTVYKVIRWMDIVVFSRCLAIADICWHERDVTEDEVIAIQQPIVPGREREDITKDDLFGVE